MVCEKSNKYAVGGREALQHSTCGPLPSLHVPHFEIPFHDTLYSRSVDPRKLHAVIKYYTVHMYSMPYYTYGSTANFLFLEPTALIYIYIYISKERCCNKDQRGVGNFKIELIEGKVYRKYLKKTNAKEKKKNREKKRENKKEIKNI